jgi:hypothetical protein
MMSGNATSALAVGLPLSDLGTDAPQFDTLPFHSGGIDAMAYYCFLCNQVHAGIPTEEHFIPRSIDGPEAQKLPACEEMNALANSIFDSNARDILYLVRFCGTRNLKRYGEALLADGTVKPFRFCYKERFVESAPHSEFSYIFDIAENHLIPKEEVYGISFRVGLIERDVNTFCCGIAKITLGAIVFLLQREKVPQEVIIQLLSQTPYKAMRHVALRLTSHNEPVNVRFSLGSSAVLESLQSSSANPELRNHVVRVAIGEATTQVDGMLSSQYGWRIELPSHSAIPAQMLRLENPIAETKAPEPLRDLALCRDSICVINPQYEGTPPALPIHWKNH